MNTDILTDNTPFTFTIILALLVENTVTNKLVWRKHIHEVNNFVSIIPDSGRQRIVLANVTSDMTNMLLVTQLIKCYQ